MNKFLSKCTKLLGTCLMVCSTVLSSFQPVSVMAEPSTRASLGLDGNSIIKEAEKHIGKGYVWGATGPNVFDCSGFTQYVFGQVGYSIPRTAEQQRQYMQANTTKLPTNDISTWNKGDLIFYGNYGEAEHVAIYAGNGEVIDCLGSMVSSLPGVTRHKYDAIADKNGHQYSIMGTYAVVDSTGEFTIQKLSEKEGWVLEGATFEITNNATGKKLVRSTNSDGVIYVTGLEPGSYTVKETKAPNGYLLDSTPKTITIKGGETIADTKLTFTDAKPTGKIILTKYNYDKSEVIPNTEYDVRYPSGTIKHVKTDSKGQVVLDNLTEFGIYSFTETQAAPGYIIDRQTQYVKMEYVDQYTKVVVKNLDHINYEPSGTLNITKNDRETGQTPQGDATLAGAVYEVIADEDIYNTQHTKIMYHKGDVVATRTSYEDGTMDQVRGLYMGTYKVVEKKAPMGYELDETEYKVTFTKEDETKEIIKYLDVYDNVKKGSVMLHKVTDATDDGSHQALAYIPFVLTDSKGQTWENVTDDEGNLTFDNLPYGTYLLDELACENNEGLSLLNDKEIVIDGTQAVYEYTIVNHASSMTFRKVDAETKNDIKGATLAVMEADTGFIITQWVSDGTPHEIRGLIDGTDYVLSELDAPAGYELADPIRFTAKDKGEVVMEDARIIEKTNVLFSKKDITSQEELPGAKLMLKEYDTNKIVKEWISGNKPVQIELEKGKKYIFEETIAPDGYVQAEVIVFVAGEEKTVTMYDEYTKVSIQKVDENGKPLAGAKLQLTNDRGDVIKTWVSGETPTLITKLPRGFYDLKELEAPEGYEIAEPVTFEVINDAKLIEVVMTDKAKPVIPVQPVEMFMSKQDITTKTELPGAEMVLTEKQSGKIVDSWTSGTEPHKVKVMPGMTYVLTEKTAPKGYLKAESITFTAKAGETVTMYDDYTKVSISKKDVANKEELPGAKLTLKDEKGNIIDSWTSGKDPHMITMLEPGKYVLIEETAPDGYKKAENVTFEVKATGEVQYVTMYDEAEEIDTGVKARNVAVPAALAGAGAVAAAAALVVAKSKKKKK